MTNRFIFHSRTVQSLILNGILGFSLSNSAHALAPMNINLDSNKGYVSFEATGKPSLLRISGKGVGASGQLIIEGSKATGTLSFDMKTLETGISMRDRHMKEKYLHVDQHPSAMLRLVSLLLPADWAKQNSSKISGPFTGLLTLHGVARNVEGQFETQGMDGQYLSVVANFRIRLSDFAIDVPSYAGITVADEVRVEVTAQGNAAASAARPASQPGQPGQSAANGG